MKFTCEIDMDNAAFEDRSEWELSDILEYLAQYVRMEFKSGYLHDTNGNACGKWEISK